MTDRSGDAGRQPGLGGGGGLGRAGLGGSSTDADLTSTGGGLEVDIAERDLAREDRPERDLTIGGDAGAQGEGAPGGEYDERRPAVEEAYGTDPESDRDWTAEGRSSTGDAAQ